MRAIMRSAPGIRDCGAGVCYRVCARPDAEQLAHEVRDVLVCDCPCNRALTTASMTGPYDVPSRYGLGALIFLPHSGHAAASITAVNVRVA